MHSVKDRRSQKLRHRTFWTVLGIPALGGLLMVVAEASLTTPAGPYDPLLFLERAMNLSNGVTPLVPALLLGLVGLGWVVTQLRRVDYVDRFWRDRVADPKLRPMDQKADDQPELQSAKKRKDRMAEAAQGVRKLLFSPIPGLMLKNLGSLAALLLTSLTAIRLAERAIPGVDGASFTRWMFLAFGLSAFLVVISLCRFLLVWGAIRHVLREVSLAPMQRAFERLPRTITREFGPYLNAIRPGLRNLEVHIRQWARVASGFQPAEAAKRVFGEGNGDVGGCMSELAGVIRGDDLDKLFDVGTTDPAERIIRAFEVECVDPGASVRLAASQVRTAMRRAAGACMTVMIPLWKDRSLDEAYGSAPVEQKAGSGATRTGATGTASEPPPGAESNPWKDWLGQAEELIALEFVQFITESSVHLKNLAQFLTFAPILILLAACSYPFQPSRFLITALWGLLVAVAVGVVFVHVQMERNELLSRVSKTSPDSISFNWTFMSQVAAILIPLLGVVLAQFPFVSDALNQLLGPLSRVLR